MLEQLDIYMEKKWTDLYRTPNTKNEVETEHTLNGKVKII